MEFRFDVVQLNRLNWRDFITKSSPVAAALMARMSIAPRDRPRVELEWLRLLATLRLNQARMRLISGFIDSYLSLNQREQADFDEIVKSLPIEETEGVMEIVTSWMEEGRRQGRREGKREGRREGKREGLEQGQMRAVRDDVLEILEARFKRIPSGLRILLKGIDDRRQLKLLLRHAATVPSIKDFERRLRGLN